MFSRAWTAIRALVFPWDLSASCSHSQSTAPTHRELEQSPPRKRAKHAPPPEHPTLPESNHVAHLSPLEAVNVDVFRLIADELHHQGGFLHNLSLSSRKLRQLSSPMLFSRCTWIVRSWQHIEPKYDYFPAPEPPEVIRPFVRHLNVYRSFPFDRDMEQFHTVLSCFPSVTSVTFAGTEGDISWPVIRFCLVNPRITSLSFSAGATDRFNSPPNLSDDTVTSSIERFSLTTTMWREHANVTADTRYVMTPPRDMNEVYRIEREWLAAIVLTMNNTAKSLTIPIETAPLREMSTVPWPKLKHLYLHGRLLASSQGAGLRALLPSLHSLETLSVQAARSKQLARPRLLDPFPSLSGHGASSSSSAPSGSSVATVVERPSTPPAILPSLRSLTIAYANPEDAIFSINAELTHLSLRDCPRFYHFLAYGGLRIGLQWGWNMPILNPAQCLSMMKRMPLSRLTSLELVYMVAATQSGNDADLLTYIGEAFPALSHLEIHRYRLQRTERVDYVHIARMLVAVKSLRTVRLNLDFHDDHQAYCGNPKKRKRWRDIFIEQRGPEILAIMQECPLLEHVALLYHGTSSATWVEFRTPRCPGPRVVLEYDSEHVDSEPLMRKKWVRE